MAVVVIVIAVLAAAGLAYLAWACATISSSVFVKAVCRKNELLPDGKEKPVVYLTFDDGPDPERTPAILEILGRRNARATFFLIGSKVPDNEALVLRMIAEGHRIGIHSFFHDWKFPFISLDKMVNDLYSCKTLLESISNNNVSYFRPPFGVTNPTIGKAVKTLDLNVIGWDVRTFDTRYDLTGTAADGVTDLNRGMDRVLRRISENVRPGSIILMHDRLPGSAELLERVLDYLDSNGYVYDTALK